MYYIKQEELKDTNRYYKLPQEFFEVKKYRKLKPNAKILYAMLYNRTSLSQKNKWWDKNGNVYIIFTREEACEKLDISINTSTSLFKELKKYNLIEEVKQGNQKANLIYVKKINVENDDESNNVNNKNGESESDNVTILANRRKGRVNHKKYKLQKTKSESQKQHKSESQKMSTSNTDINNTKNNTLSLRENFGNSKIEEAKEIIEHYNNICIDLPKVFMPTQQRIENIIKINKQLSQNGYNPMTFFKGVFFKLHTTKFFRGVNRLNWVASFDWLFEKKDRLIHILEGRYDDNMSNDDIGLAILAKVVV